MEALWLSKDAGMWRAALDVVGERVAAHSKEGYPELDEWFFTQLPERLAERGASRSLLGAELVNIVEWKLKRGTWRPKLLDYAKNLPDEEVQSASRQALAAIEGAAEKSDADFVECCSSAMATLTRLKGVGPATASAVLTAADPSFPYMADGAMDVSTDKQREYTVKRYVEYAVLMRQKARALSSEGDTWTPKNVERALQSEELLHTTPAKKRKRT